MSDTIVVALGLPEAAAAAAAADALGAGRAVLLLVNAADVPELSTPAADVPAFATVAQRFERVLLLNDLIFPEHPRAWSPGRRARRGFRQRLIAESGLAPDARLALPLEVSPALATLASTFPRSHVVRTPEATLSGDLASAAARLADVARDDARIDAALRTPEATGADADPSPWRRIGMPAPIARILPRRWFEPMREWSRRWVWPLVIRWRRRRQDFAAVALPDLTAEDFERDLRP